MRQYIERDETFGARNYLPLPVVLERGEGVYVFDTEGRRYLDLLSAYSSLNQGHCHPRIAAAMRAQLGKLTLTSRAFHHTLMGPLLERICLLTRMEKAVLMNSGAEAVETAVKAMRLWGYRRKGIARDEADILVADGNFHGRTTTIVGFSSDPASRDGFGPATPGFRSVPYGNAEALESAVTARTCGFLVEPIQGEAGVIIPPSGYLAEVRRICDRRGILLCLDEIQTGLGRTGDWFCARQEGVQPDLFVLGKALSGGFYPVSAVASRTEVLGLFEPGTHGSTFGGNPLACAAAMAALDVLEQEGLPTRAAEMGAYFLERLRGLDRPGIRETRGRGLLLAVEFDAPVARAFCERLLRRGILAKDTRRTTVRLAPPLIITREQVDEALAAIAAAL